MRIRASLWVSLATVMLLSPAVLVARFTDGGLVRLAANRVPLPAHPPLPMPRQSPPVLPVRTAAPATSALPPLGMVRDRPEELGQVPDHFFWLRGNLMAVQDPLDGQLVFLDDNGHVTGRGALPNDFHIGAVASGPDVVRLIDTTGRRQMAIARNIDASAIRSVQALPIMADGSARAALVTRRGRDLLQLRDETNARARALDVRSVTGAPLAQAYEIAPDPDHARYVVSEEIAATSPALRVEVFVRRYGNSGEVTGIVHVPLDGFEVVPHDFITVGADGVVRVLAPTAAGVVIRHYEFTAPPRGRIVQQDLKSLGRSLRQVNVDSRVSVNDPLDKFRDANEPPLDIVLPPPPPITRAAILANARAFLDVNWTMQQENFMRPGIDNACVPRQGRIWLRPRHFTRDMIGKTIGPMPYRWGGDDTPNTFRIRTEWGALAGSICTCRVAEFNYCLFADSAGVDCSGFVSRAWGIDKRGTAGLLDVADDVESLDAIEPGDAFDWPQRHIRLFMGLANGPETAFTVLESSTRIDCEGVCEATYRPSELNGYRLIRYRNIREGTIATSDATAAPAPQQEQAAPPSGERRAPARRVSKLRKPQRKGAHR